MARKRSSHIREALTSLISPQFIRRRARALGVVQRKRRVDIVALVYTLVLGFDRGARRSLASLRRAFAVATGVTLAPSAFYDRFTPALATLMWQLTQRAFAGLSKMPSELARPLDVFRKVFIADGSLIRLRDALAADYPSVWTNHTLASAKLHTVINASSRTPEIVRIVPGSSHDVNLISPASWCRGALLIFDLAYYQGKLFKRILDQGGHFLCRVKKDANFTILEADDRSWIGRKHKEILSRAQGRSFELEILYVYRHMPERDWLKRELRLRLIAVWRKDCGCHRMYLTSVTKAHLPATLVPGLYSMRWEIELMFRELKSQLRIEQIPSGNKSVADCLLYASLLALALGRRLHHALCRHRSEEHCVSTPPERWTGLIRSVAALILQLLLAPATVRAHLEKRLRSLLLYEAPDPNRHRLLLVNRALLGVVSGA